MDLISNVAKQSQESVDPWTKSQNMATMAINALASTEQLPHKTKNTLNDN